MIANLNNLNLSLQAVKTVPNSKNHKSLLGNVINVKDRDMPHTAKILTVEILLL